VTAPATGGVPDAVEVYLADVGRRLPGGRRVRRDILDELADGLSELVERHSPADRAAAAALMEREFGDPATVSAAFASELRVRLARRNAVVVLVLLTATGLAWSAYQALVGVPAAIAPAGWRGTVFSMSIDALRACATVAQVATAAFAILASLAPPRTLARALPARLLEVQLPQLLMGTAVAAVTGFGAAVVLMIATAATPYRPAMLLAGAPVLAVILLAARGSGAALHHVRAAGR
jgi:hypothetical protein